ncbi:Dehydrogenase (flavoprotein) [Succiniclasticum ruminis]|uniref:Dehydrogenase (Flavoprotein) n=2 Tax=Succiniclasticum ruminis TaxID=40841 RepID=A0A1G6MNP0_9FIRM|nr:Dehydrogenase (flavoprotein) [Succiniclasticum ruminis]
MWGLVMKRIRVDFLIVGAGLAGSVAGFLLKKAGADVLALELLDAKTKEKLCGGIMNKRALTQVAEVFGEGCMDTLRPMHIEKVWDRYAGLEILIESDVYYALPRKRLDDYCLERYLQAGGMLQDRTTVREIDDSAGVAICADLRTGETFEVEFGRIIGADGAMSAVRRLLTGRNQRVGITLEGVVPLMSRDGVFEYLSREVGYSWYIPRGEDAVVGCGSYPGNAEICREGMNSLCRGLQIEEPRCVRGAAIPTGDDTLLEYGRRTCFVGDAAGLIAASSGAGIELAVTSARLLSESLLNGNSYTEAMKPKTDYIARLAQDAKKSYFVYRFFIMRKGRPAKPFVSEKTR